MEEAQKQEELQDFVQDTPCRVMQIPSEVEGVASDGAEPACRTGRVLAAVEAEDSAGVEVSVEEEVLEEGSVGLTPITILTWIRSRIPTTIPIRIRTFRPPVLLRALTFLMEARSALPA